MTGEITLKGRVLPVGGIKEKCIAAHSNGIKTFFLLIICYFICLHVYFFRIILPYLNIKDTEEISSEIKNNIEYFKYFYLFNLNLKRFKFVKSIEEVLEIAYEDYKEISVLRDK